MAQADLPGTPVRKQYQHFRDGRSAAERARVRRGDARLIALRERITLAERGAKQLEESPPASVSSAPTTALP